MKRFLLAVVVGLLASVALGLLFPESFSSLPSPYLARFALGFLGYVLADLATSRKPATAGSGEG